MHITYQMPQSVPRFSIHDVISVDIIGGNYSVHMEHAHKSAWEIVYQISGMAKVCIGDQWMPIRQNQFIFIQPKTLHDMILDHADAQAIICAFIPEGKYTVCPNMILQGTHREREIIEQIISELSRNANAVDQDGYYSFPDENRTIEVHQLLCCYLQQFSIKSRSVSPWGGRETAYHTAIIRGKDHDYVVDQINTYIARHISEQITVAALARLFHYNRSWLYRVYKEATGEDIMTAITRHRMEHAKEMLVNTNVSIQDVAKQSGFHSLSYFSKRCRIVTGMSPTEYRISYQKS